MLCDKLVIIANGLGIIRYATYFEDEFKANHPNLVMDKKSNSLAEDKSLGDSSPLSPVSEDFFSIHPSLKPPILLGESTFDTKIPMAFKIKFTLK